MRKRIYISADYSLDSGDREVVELLNKWGNDDLHKIDFVDMAKVVSGSVSNNPDCRPCDLKREFNAQINASSAVIVVVGDKTRTRTAGSNCLRTDNIQMFCQCTPYKQNANGTKMCKVIQVCAETDNVGDINKYSYIRHEFEQAKKRAKDIIVVYNSLRNEHQWLPDYMKGCKFKEYPFWKNNFYGQRIGNYDEIKRALGYA